MELSIRPLSFSQVIWENLKDYITLDSSRDETRLLRTLGADRIDPVNSSHDTGQHISASFVCYVDDETLIEIHRLNLKVFSTPSTRHMYIVILSGTITELANAAILGCHSNSNYGTRFLCNGIIQYLEHAGFKALWSAYNKTKINDGTYVLEPR